MSDARPFQFRRLDSERAPASSGLSASGAPSAPSVGRPSWLTTIEAQIRPAPFTMRDEPAPVPVAESDAAGSPSPFEDVQPGAYEPVPEPPRMPRRSSLPPRHSLPPPPVVISRLPPPPSLAVEAKPSAEQEAFANAALELASMRARILSTVESELLDLAVHIARSILEREVTLDPSLHGVLARTAVLALGDTQAARVRVSRKAYKAITELYGEGTIDVDGVRVDVSMDNSLDAMSVVAEAGPSRVDARIGERLSAVLRAMQAEHRRNNAPGDEP